MNHHPMAVGKQPLLWLDFGDKDALELSGDCISQAKDKSGRGHHFYNYYDITEKPVWVDDGAQFGEIQYLKSNTFGSGFTEIFYDYIAVVILPNDLYRKNRWGNLGRGIGYPLFNGVPITVGPKEGSQLVENIPRIIGVKIDNYPTFQASLYNNGKKTSSRNFFNDHRSSKSELSLGHGRVYSGMETPVIKELLLFRSLEEHQRQSITRYLANKWDIKI